MVDTTELARQLVETRKQREEADERLKSLKELERKLISDLLQAWEASDRHKDNVDGHTLYVLRDVQVSVKDPEDKESAYTTLRENGLGWLIKEDYHYQSLKSAVKELEREAESGDKTAQAKLDAIRERFNVVEQFNIGVRAERKSDSARRFKKATI